MHIIKYQPNNNDTSSRSLDDLRMIGITKTLIQAGKEAAELMDVNDDSPSSFSSSSTISSPSTSDSSSFTTNASDDWAKLESLLLSLVVLFVANLFLFPLPDRDLLHWVEDSTRRTDYLKQ